jgi:uncharacterized membrane protein YgcG
MVSAIVVLAIAAGGRSLACRLLVRRRQDRRLNRFFLLRQRCARGGNFGGLDALGLSNWSGAGHSALDGSANRTDGGGDAGGGGDGGGGSSGD